MTWINGVPFGTQEIDHCNLSKGFVKHAEQGLSEGYIGALSRSVRDIGAVNKVDLRSGLLSSTVVVRPKNGGLAAISAPRRSNQFAD